MKQDERKKMDTNIEPILIDFFHNQAFFMDNHKNSGDIPGRHEKLEKDLEEQFNQEIDLELIYSQLLSPGIIEDTDIAFSSILEYLRYVGIVE